MDIGIMGGTFDPIHTGHLVAAEEARVQLRLSEVVFVPAGQPWLKPNRQITPAVHRVEMLRLAIGPNPYFRLSTLELDRAGPSYTVETIPALAEELGTDTHFFFIVGLDKLAELSHWREPRRLLEMCELVAVTRPGYGRLDVDAVDAALPGASGRIRVLDIPLIGVSSSLIRERVGEGLSVRYLVPPGVDDYIRDNGLYRG